MGQANSTEDHAERLEKLDADMAIEYDVDARGQEDPGSSERVIVAAWENAMDIALKHGVGMARTVPWDAGRASAAASDGAMNDGLLAKIFESKVVGDSAAISTKEEGSQPLLSGQPIHSNYTNRYLPNVVRKHWYDHHPTNGTIWDRDKVGHNGYEETSEFHEVARNHPGDDPIDNHLLGVDGRSFLEIQAANGSYNSKKYQPVLTKAGSRLWGIAFASPSSTMNDAMNDNGEGGGDKLLQQHELSEIRASYPGQILVRLDRGRGLIAYDAFEFVPTSMTAFQRNARHGNVPVTADELEGIEKLLRKTKPRREDLRRKMRSFVRSWAIMGQMEEDDDDNEEDEGEEEELLDPSEPISRRWEHIGAIKVHQLLNWNRFKQSRVFRARFPADSICGARFLIFDYSRPNADSIPPPEGECTLDQLGDCGDDPDGGGNRARRGTLEFCEGIEPIGVLILELAQRGSNCDPYERNPFASSILWPRSQLLRKRVGLDYDWLPNEAFSKSTRHYIFGDASEIKELTNAMMAAFPRLRMLLTVHPKQTGEVDDATRRREESLDNCNTLLGAIENLHPTKSPPSVQSLRSQLSFSMLKSEKILEDFPPPTSAREPDGFASKNDVHDFLRRCGVDDAESVNRCLKAGLLNGCVSVPDELKQAEDASEFLETTLLEGHCNTCDRDISCTVRMALHQAEFGSYGDGYESDAAINCGTEDEEYMDSECDGTYITGLCRGDPQFTSGKFHNHCDVCPNFGTCIGDYRNSHCYHCGEHYFRGNYDFPCSCGGDPDDVDLDMDRHGDEDDGEINGDELAMFVAPPQHDCWQGYVCDDDLDTVKEAFANQTGR